MFTVSLLPIVLDLDDSVACLPNERRLQIIDRWREKIRFGSRIQHYWEFCSEVDTWFDTLGNHGTVFTGSGDFHHLSLALVKRCLKKYLRSEPVRLIVFDNHPDNMRFPWGIHCGSWVYHAAMLPGISHVHVIGITSKDISWKHSWENYLTPLISGKLTYWSVGVNVSWANLLGIGKAFRNFGDVCELVNAFCNTLTNNKQATYISIDKDVFSSSIVRTNWDQGQFGESELNHVIKALDGDVIGSDITGDVSEWHYSTSWKRWLSRADGQQLNFGHDLASLQNCHASLNLKLLNILSGAVL